MSQMNNITECEFAREVKAAHAEQKSNLKQRPDLAAGYAQAAWCLAKVLRGHYDRGCSMCAAEAKNSEVAA